MEIAIIGLGERGRMYAEYVLEMGAKIAAIVEPDQVKREKAQRELGISDERFYTNVDMFFAKGKIADALIISTRDNLHYEMAMKALDLHYPLLLEKPISNRPAECIEIRDKAEKLGVPVTVCHVLRYAPFFSKIKKILESGELGKVVTIQHTENIGNFHMAHSYVRGNWRRSDEAAPIILTKSCHDLDLLIWLTGSVPVSVASFGNLTYFKKDNAPKGSADRCMECGVSSNCRFDARKAYLPAIGQWPATVLTQDQTEEGLLKAINEGPYGRCVYKCDNDVCDHQVMIVNFENGVTATFNLTAFSNRFSRTLKIMCEDGEIKGNLDMNVIEIVRYASNMVETYNTESYYIGGPANGHGGGDKVMVKEFLNSINSGCEMNSSISVSVASHVLAFAAEKARVTKTVVEIADFEKELIRG